MIVVYCEHVKDCFYMFWHFVKRLPNFRKVNEIPKKNHIFRYFTEDNCSKPKETKMKWIHRLFLLFVSTFVLSWLKELYSENTCSIYINVEILRETHIRLRSSHVFRFFSYHFFPLNSVYRMNIKSRRIFWNKSVLVYYTLVIMSFIS